MWASRAVVVTWQSSQTWFIYNLAVVYSCLLIHGHNNSEPSEWRLPYAMFSMLISGELDQWRLYAIRAMAVMLYRGLLRPPAFETTKKVIKDYMAVPHLLWCPWGAPS